MFKVKQLLTKNYLLCLHIKLFLVDFNSLVVSHSQNLSSCFSYKAFLESAFMQNTHVEELYCIVLD